MFNAILVITAIESAFGTLLTGTILFLVLTRGRRPYHYLFAAFLLICVVWDAGVFLMMLRNEHAQELEALGRITITPCILIPALIFHFANLYSGRPIRWAVGLLWGLTAASLALVFAGVFYQIEGIYAYSWGNIFRVVPSVLDPMIFVFWFGINLPACWLLYKSAARAATPLDRRHHAYVIAGLLIVTFAIVKALVTIGIDAGFLLPLGMFLNDVFVAVIGVAIIKDRLFDITVVVRKGTLYSILGGLLLFLYSFFEHILITYSGKLIGAHSDIIHLVSIGAGVALLLPVKRRLEHGIDAYFAQRKLAF